MPVKRQPLIETARRRSSPHPLGTAPPTVRLVNRKLVGTICGLLVLAVAVIYAHTVRFPFLDFDDSSYLFEYPQVAAGLTGSGVAWAVSNVHFSNWHPLTTLAQMCCVQCFGQWAGGHHLVNVLLHAATAVLLFLWLRGMTGELWPSALAAALFTVHPLRVESVAWVAELKDVLSGLFFVLTLMAYVAYVRQPFSWRRYLLVLGAFALALMSKPMVVTLPGVLLLLDAWPLGRFAAGRADQPLPAGPSPGWGWVPRRLIVEKLPLLALIAGSAAATLAAQGGAIQHMIYIPWDQRVSNAIVVCVAYLEKFFLPVGLVAVYPHPEGTLPAWQVAGSLAVLAMISLAAMRWRRRAPYFLVGWLWYLGMLVPVLGFVQVGYQAMADRYTYLPQIGLAIALAWGAARAAQAWSLSPRVCGIAAATVILALAAAAWRQTWYWSDREALWTHTLACTSRNYLAHDGMGKTYYDRGRFPEAIAQFEQAIALKPEVAEPYNLLGLALGRLQPPRTAESIAAHRKAVALMPGEASFQGDLAKALAAAGELAEATDHMEQAVRLDPNSAAAHNDLGKILADRGQLAAAVPHFERAVQMHPGVAGWHNNLGIVLGRLGRFDAAVAHFERALQLQPDLESADFNLKVTLKKRQARAGAGP